MFEATSIGEATRCIITSCMVSANVESKEATITACSGPKPPSTTPTGTYPTTFATTSETRAPKFSVG